MTINFPNLGQVTKEEVQDESKTVKEPFVISVIDEDIMKKVTILFHSTVGFLFFILLFSPVTVIFSNTYLDSSSIYFKNYNSFEGVFIAGLGWLGIITGSISWYWFIGYIYIASKIKSGLNDKALLMLNCFFVACLFGLHVFRLGASDPGGIDHSSGIIGQHLSGYYIYSILIVFLMISSLFFYKKATSQKRYYFYIILSLCTIFTSIFFFCYMNPFFRPSLVDNAKAYALNDKMQNTIKNTKKFNEEVKEYFESQNKVKLLYQKIKLTCFTGKCDSLYFTIANVYPGDYEEVKDLLEKRIIDEYGPKVTQLTNMYFEDQANKEQKYKVILETREEKIVEYVCTYTLEEKLKCSY
ncbi:MAG: hypothetical protein KBC21_01335 [Candidatus Pacebacteria bacterium]|nr:hypothetical protein [Candidatus Paceibacterota bacterium]